VFLSFREEGIQVPFARFEGSRDKVEWKPPVYRSLYAVLENPRRARYVVCQARLRVLMIPRNPPVSGATRHIARAEELERLPLR
jgi:hypothetical protein